MKVLTLIIVALSFAAAVYASDFLDGIDSKSDKKSSKKFHEVDLDREEMINDGKGSKYAPTTLIPIDSTTATTDSHKVTTEAPKVTTDETHKDTLTTSKVRTTSNVVPVDDVTTTEKIKTTTSSKSSNVLPPNNSHSFKWILGGLFFGIFVVVLSLYLVKFYRNHTESSYQNL